MTLIAVALVLLILLSTAINLYVDWLWFDEVGYTQVFSTPLLTQLSLFALFGVGMALVVWANLVIAYRLRPTYRPMSLEQQNLERYRLAVSPRFGLLAGLAAGFVGLIAGLAAQAQWRT
ncbi:MAG TPA: UPF0182 family protein, partial [Cryptosporangiaceae bacterium]|nr:UPF0182 family protein [Cryptosporangiaceae bacterium]